MKLNVRSEINPLRLVITHKPGKEHECITPKNLKEEIQVDGKIINNPDYLLFDDIIYVENAIKEHNDLYDILHYFTDGNAYEFTDLLNEVLKDNNIKKELIKECIKSENDLYNNKIELSKLEGLNSKDLIDTMLSGYIENDKIFNHPLPNLIFTRDIAVCIGNTILITWSSKDVRKRENILAKYVFSHYKSFKDLNVYDFHIKHPELSIEGGDILIFDKETICVGVSERTPLESVQKILPLIYNEGFKKIIAVDLPKKRALMHLDTIFTRINTKEVLVFPPILETNYEKHLNKTYIFKNGQIEPSSTNKDLVSVLNHEGFEIKFIKCGSDSKIMQEREQWTDGANAFTLSPGKIIGYDCNRYTLMELEKNGYKAISAKEYLDNYNKYNEENTNFIITIKGSELSRGRGGPRCLTMPLLRI